MAETATTTGAASPVTTAGATTAQATATVGTGAAPAAEWTSGFSDDMKGYVQNKGWKNAQEIADSYRNFEKNYAGVGQERLLKLPESWESPEAQAVWEKLGKPKDAKGYALKVPEKGDPKLAEWASDVFLKSNLTADQAQKVMSAWNDRQTAVQTQTVENQKIALSQATEKLKTEWGAAYDKNMNLAKSGMMALELDSATVDLMANTMGAEKVFKQLSKIGAGIGESSFVAGRPAGDGTVTPEQARNEIEELKRDHVWVQKYLGGDFDAKKRMEHLMKMATPGDIRLT